MRKIYFLCTICFLLKCSTSEESDEIVLLKGTDKGPTYKVINNQAIELEENRTRPQESVFSKLINIAILSNLLGYIFEPYNKIKLYPSNDNNVKDSGEKSKAAAFFKNWSEIENRTGNADNLTTIENGKENTADWTKIENGTENDYNESSILKEKSEVKLNIDEQQDDAGLELERNDYEDEYKINKLKIEDKDDESSDESVAGEISNESESLIYFKKPKVIVTEAEKIDKHNIPEITSLKQKNKIDNKKNINGDDSENNSNEYNPDLNISIKNDNNNDNVKKTNYYDENDSNEEIKIEDKLKNKNKNEINLLLALIFDQDSKFSPQAKYDKTNNDNKDERDDNDDTKMKFESYINGFGEKIIYRKNLKNNDENEDDSEHYSNDDENADKKDDSSDGHSEDERETKSTEDKGKEKREVKSDEKNENINDENENAENKNSNNSDKNDNETENIHDGKNKEEEDNNNEAEIEDINEGESIDKEDASTEEIIEDIGDNNDKEESNNDDDNKDGDVKDNGLPADKTTTTNNIYADNLYGNQTSGLYSAGMANLSHLRRRREEAPDCLCPPCPCPKTTRRPRPKPTRRPRPKPTRRPRPKPTRKPHPKVCRVPSNLAHSELRCTDDSHKVVCKQKCVFGYTLRQGVKRTQKCYMNRGRWSPSRMFSDCKPFVDCTVRVGPGGKKKCYNNYMNQGPKCEISCKAHGDYPPKEKETHRCNIKGEWLPYLPYCVEAGTRQRLVNPPKHIPREWQTHKGSDEEVDEDNDEDNEIESDETDDCNEESEEEGSSKSDENGSHEEKDSSKSDENGSYEEEDSSKSDENGSHEEEDSSKSDENGSHEEKDSSKSDENGSHEEEDSSKSDENGSSKECKHKNKKCKHKKH